MPFGHLAETGHFPGLPFYHKRADSLSLFFIGCFKSQHHAEPTPQPSMQDALFPVAAGIGFGF
jgi:hypothetical protein